MKKESENMADKWEKLSIEIFPEEAQTLDLIAKDFKSAIINIFRELNKTTSKELKKNMRIKLH